MLIEDLQHDLLSVNALRNKSYTVNFVSDDAEILLNGRLQFSAHKVGKLYEVTFHIDKFAFVGTSKCVRYEEIDFTEYGLWYRSNRNQYRFEFL